MPTIAFQVAEASAPLFVDAYAIDINNKWVFGSFWGHETILQEFMARLTIPKHEDGLSAFTLTPVNNSGHERCELHVGKSKRLSRVSAKTPPSTIVGPLCHIWIFDTALKKPNHGEQEAYVMGYGNETEAELVNRVWFQVCQLCSLPLLPHWKASILPQLFDQAWITPLSGVGIHGYRIRLPDDELANLVSDGVRSRKLSVNPSDQPRSTQSPRLLALL